jgi:hypothetical protein
MTSNIEPIARKITRGIRRESQNAGRPAMCCGNLNFPHLEKLTGRCDTKSSFPASCLKRANCDRDGGDWLDKKLN